MSTPSPSSDSYCDVLKNDEKLFLVGKNDDVKMQHVSFNELKALFQNIYTIEKLKMYTIIRLCDLSKFIYSTINNGFESLDGEFLSIELPGITLDYFIIIKYINNVVSNNDTLQINIKEKRICQKKCDYNANEYLLELLKNNIIQQEIHEDLKLVSFKVYKKGIVIGTINEDGLCYINEIEKCLYRYSYSYDRYYYSYDRLKTFYQDIVNNIKLNNKIFTKWNWESPDS